MDESMSFENRHRVRHQRLPTSPAFLSVMLAAVAVTPNRCAAADVDLPANSAVSATTIRLTTQPEQDPMTIQTPTAPPASPSKIQDDKKHQGFQRPPIGLDVGTFIPANAKTRNRFGGSWVSIGPGIGKIVPNTKPSLEPDIAYLTQRHDSGGFSNRAGVLLLGVGYRSRLAAKGVPEETTIKLLPYAGGSLNAVFSSLRSDADIRKGTSTGIGGSAFVGASLGKTAFLDARYRFLSGVKGFDLSGVAIQAGVRF
jgi:hypothetical protein